MSFLIDKVECEGITFDDVLLLPACSEIIPRKVDLLSKITRTTGSIEAMQKGSKNSYLQDMEEDIKKLVVEGFAARAPYKGTVYEVLNQLTGGLRAGTRCCRAANIEQLRNEKFTRISNAGVQESQTHDVTIMQEAPNYSLRQ